MTRSREMMLREIQELDFRLYELRLFLNTHPFDQCAAAEYAVTQNKGKSMREHFEKLYGPLTINSDAAAAQPERWVEGPWPWEYVSEKKEEVCQ